MDETAYAAYLRQVKESEKIKSSIIELYGEYTEHTVRRAFFDKLITMSEKQQLARNCPL